MCLRPKTRFLISTIIAVFILTTFVAGAAPDFTPLGDDPIYDSGWILSIENVYGEHTFMVFDHNLGAYPTHFAVYVAKDGDGSYPDVADTRVSEIFCNELWVYISTTLGHSYSRNERYWAGEDYIRVLIFSADPILGSSPCEPASAFQLWLPLIVRGS